jgi:hypothetical protein
MVLTDGKFLITQMLLGLIPRSQTTKTLMGIQETLQVFSILHRTGDSLKKKATSNQIIIQEAILEMHS